MRRPHQSRWATAFAGLASVRGRESRCGRSVEAPYFSVSQRVEHEGDQLAGDGYARLVLAPAFGDAAVVGTQRLVAFGPVVADSLD